MATKDFGKGYLLGTLIMAALDLLTVNNTVDNLKKEMMNTDKTKIVTQKKIKKDNKTFNTIIITPAHIIPDSTIMKLKI